MCIFDPIEKKTALNNVVMGFRFLCLIVPFATNTKCNPLKKLPLHNTILDIQPKCNKRNTSTQLYFLVRVVIKM